MRKMTDKYECEESMLSGFAAREWIHGMLRDEYLAKDKMPLDMQQAKVVVMCNNFTEEDTDRIFNVMLREGDIFPISDVLIGVSENCG
jgi:hypothetical protein